MDLNTIQDIARPRQRNGIPDWKAGDAWLAGGTWLFSEPQPQLNRLIDVTGFGWPALTVSDDALEIAATCKVAELAAFTPPIDWIAAPLFDQCCRSFLASFKIWNMATIGGNLCNSLPAGPMISLTAALEGLCTIWTPEGADRRMSVVDFIKGPQRNALRPGELLRAITLPISALKKKTAFRQMSLTTLGRSAALLIGTVSPIDGSFVLMVTASTPRPVQISFAALPSAGELRAKVERTIPAAGYYDDIHGAPDWRRHITLLMAEEIRRELEGGLPA